MVNTVRMLFEEAFAVFAVLALLIVCQTIKKQHYVRSYIKRPYTCDSWKIK